MRLRIIKLFDAHGREHFFLEEKRRWFWHHIDSFYSELEAKNAYHNYHKACAPSVVIYPPEECEKP